MNSNTEIGRRFQLRSRQALTRLLQVPFEMEVHLPIGNPPKNHPFDLVSADKMYVGEAKAFTWTISGNTPSAKITTLREAAQYLHALPPGTKTLIVMKHSPHPRTGETLAHYFARLNGHLLGQTAILELDEGTDSLTIIRRGLL